MNETWSRHQRWLGLPLITLAFAIQALFQWRYSHDAFRLSQAWTITGVISIVALSTVYATFAEKGSPLWPSLAFMPLASWVLIDACAETYLRLGLLDNGKRVQDIATARYFSVVTWTALGYGDVTPIGYSRLLCALEAAIGYCYLGIWVALLVRSLAEAGAKFRGSASTDFQ